MNQFFSVGIVLGFIGQKSKRLLLLPAIVFFILPPLLPGRFLPDTDYLVSAIPMFGMVLLIYLKKYKWTPVLGLLYLPVVWAVIYYSFDRQLAVDFPAGKNLSELNLRNIKSGEKLEWQEGSEAYLLAYWHRGCGYCIRLEEVLADLKKSYPELDLQIVSVETRGEDYKDLKGYMKRWHSNFSNYRDRNRIIQNTTKTNAGPVLVLADAQKNIRKVYIGYFRDLKWYGPLYLRHKIKTF